MRVSTLEPKVLTNSLNNFPVPSSPGSRTSAGKGRRAASVGSQNVEIGLTSSQTSALVSDQQQESVMSMRQLGTAHVQSLFRDGNVIGDPFRDVHGDQTHVTDTECLRANVRAADRDELQFNINGRDQGFFEDRRDDSYFRIVGIVIGS